MTPNDHLEKLRPIFQDAKTVTSVAPLIAPIFKHKQNSSTIKLLKISRYTFAPTFLTSLLGVQGINLFRK